MKPILVLVALSIVILAGCKRSKATSGAPVGWYGGVTVIESGEKQDAMWGGVANAPRNDVRFIIVAPPGIRVPTGPRSVGYTTYWDMVRKQDGQLWQIQTSLDAQTSNFCIQVITPSLKTNVDAKASQFWQLSADGRLAAVQELDPKVKNEVLRGILKQRNEFLEWENEKMRRENYLGR